MDTKDFVTSFRKEFGEDSIFLLGEDERLADIKVRSSGSLLLDLAMGGGFAQGRLSLLQGAEKAGKCVTKDTRVLTTEGYKTLEEIFESRGVALNNSPKEIAIEYPLINRYGDVENTSHFTVNGKKTIYHVTTSKGIEQKITGNHPLLILDSGVMVWKMGRDLQVGDVVVSRKGDKISSTDYKIAKTEAYLLGLLVADGLFQKSGERMGFTNDNPEIKTFFEENYNLLKGLEEVELRMYDSNGKGSIDYHLNSKDGLKTFYNYYGIDKGLSKDKTVPACIRESHIDIQREFLRGYLECEAHIAPNDYIMEVISASRQLISEVQLMLKNLGVIGSLKPKTVKNYEHNEYFRLVIFGESVLKLSDELGRFTAINQQKLEQFNPDTVRTDSIYGIDDLVVAYYRSLSFKDRNRGTISLISKLGKGANCTKEVLSKLLKFEGNTYLKSLLSLLVDEHLYFDPIESINILDKENTFDVCMPKTHSFVAESNINHNTTIAYMAIAEAQKNEDKETAIIDLENGFSPDWAQKLGVDSDKLMILQPDTHAEKVYDMLEYMLKSKRFSIITLDSVDGLVPKDELEETDWDKESRVGGTAKINSKAMRKIINSGILRDSETSLIFIQQLRDKIGGFSLYGTPTTTSGGRSLRHASTHTLEIAIGDYFTKGTGRDRKYFGQQIRVKVAKNKIAAPFRQASIDIYYEHGVDRIAELIAVSKEIGVLQGTNWLTLTNPITGEIMVDEEGNDLKWNGVKKTQEALMKDIKNNEGKLYTKIFSIVQEVIRG